MEINYIRTQKQRESYSGADIKATDKHCALVCSPSQPNAKTRSLENRNNNSVLEQDHDFVSNNIKTPQMYP